MPTLARPPAAASLPTYALYGEPGRSQATDWLHVESIAARSQRHDWEIRPHRHAALFQILHISQGEALLWLDGRSEALAGPCALCVPPLVPHGFHFAPDIEGTVVTVLDQHLARQLAPLPTLQRALAQPLLLRWAAAGNPEATGTHGVAHAMAKAAAHALPVAAAMAASVADAVAALAEEFAGSAAWRDLALDAALLRLAVALGRAAPPPGDTASGGTARAQAHVQRFRALVALHYRDQPTLASLAATLGITPTQLNRVCHQVLGHSALGVLHARLVLEAQRDLAYTTLSVKQIALGLGFGDAGYFTRFFQRETGHTPTGWRALAAR